MAGSESGESRTVVAISTIDSHTANLIASYQMVKRPMWGVTRFLWMETLNAQRHDNRNEYMHTQNDTKLNQYYARLDVCDRGVYTVSQLAHICHRSACCRCVRPMIKMLTNAIGVSASDLHFVCRSSFFSVFCFHEEKKQCKRWVLVVSCVAHRQRQRERCAFFSARISIGSELSESFVLMARTRSPTPNRCFEFATQFILCVNFVVADGSASQWYCFQRIMQRFVGVHFCLERFTFLHTRRTRKFEIVIHFSRAANYMEIILCADAERQTKIRN